MEIYTTILSIIEIFFSYHIVNIMQVIFFISQNILTIFTTIVLVLSCYFILFAEKISHSFLAIFIYGFLALNCFKIFIFLVVLALLIYDASRDVNNSKLISIPKPVLGVSNTKQDTNLDKFNENSNSDEPQGYIDINGVRTLVSKSYLLSLLSLPAPAPLCLETFRSLVCGIFVSEGHVGCSFTSLYTVSSRARWKITQNASLESLLFFRQLKAVLNCDIIYITSLTSSGNWHVTLRCSSWPNIIHVIIPYLNQVYGPKYVALQSIITIYELLKTQNLLASKIEIVLRVYIINSAGTLKVPMNTKLENVTGLSFNNIVLPILNIPTPYSTPINLAWLLGFYLGDGNLYSRIRDVTNNIEFIPLFRIEQVWSTHNDDLMNNISNFLTSIGINSTIYITANNYKIGIKVEGKQAVGILLAMFQNNLASYFYWKAPQINTIQTVIRLLDVGCTNWLKLQEIILTAIYAVSNNREISIDYWIQRLSECHKQKLAGTVTGQAYISLGNTSQYWIVKLPDAARMPGLPKEKSFSFAKYKNNNEALAAAVDYRDKALARKLNQLLQ
jgi:hypothetical protein